MKKVGILLLTGTLLLCSCGQAKETAENSADVPETIQTNLTANPYFDISDLTYDGTETQNIAIGYSFEDPADNDPVLTYDRYLSADGETFCFDADGRLCKYEKGDADTAEKAESGSMTAAYTMAQRQQRSLDVAESLLAEDTQLEVSSFGSEYLVTNDAVTPTGPYLPLWMWTAKEKCVSSVSAITRCLRLSTMTISSKSWMRISKRQSRPGILWTIQ